MPDASKPVEHPVAFVRGRGAGLNTSLFRGGRDEPQGSLF
jgi:hypothetical protein